MEKGEKWQQDGEKRNQALSVVSLPKIRSTYNLDPMS